MKTLLIIMTVALWIGVSEARDPSQVRAFRADHPCPATGHLTGACKGWVVDHFVPLACGGADIPANMAWQTTADALKKDKWERKHCQALKEIEEANGGEVLHIGGCVHAASH